MNKPSSITQWQVDNDKGSRGSMNAKIYVRSNVNDLLDKYFDKHDIYSFPFKSVVWGRVCRMGQVIVARELEKLLIQKFPELKIESIKFSHKCGCSCGCSPGYNIILKEWTKDVSRHDGWADVFVDEKTLNTLKYAMVESMGDIQLEKMKASKQRVKGAVEYMNKSEKGVATFNGFDDHCPRYEYAH